MKKQTAYPTTKGTEKFNPIGPKNIDIPKYATNRSRVFFQHIFSGSQPKPLAKKRQFVL